MRVSRAFFVPTPLVGRISFASVIQNNMNDLLTEITSERHYLLQPAAFNAYRRNIMRGEDAKRGEREEKRRAVARFDAGQLVTDCHRLTDFRAYDDEWDEDDAPSAEADVKYINILRLTGPMTRGGGECSYGSLEMRDELMRAADRDDVVGHVIYCRTTGGAATTLLDFRKAIEYIHSKGQKIYMFCDGTVASGGAFLSAMCDGVYAYNEEDEIGSIGLYTAFFSLPNGAVDAITQETYVEVYADKSTEKNRPYRDGGDEELVRKEANEYLDELLTAMKADRPSILEEQMNGAMFKMKDVVGTIIDGICTLPELCQMIYAGWAADQQAILGGDAADDDTQANTNPNTNPQMKEYKNIATALGYEEPMASQVDDMLSLQPSEAEALEGKLAEMSGSVETLTAENTTLKEREVALNASLATMTIERYAARKEAEELRAAAAESDETRVNAVREEMQATIDSMAAEKTALEEAKAGVEAQLKTVNDEMATLKANADAAATKAATDMAEKEQIISDLQAQLAEAQSGIESKVDAGESAASNGQAAGASVMTSAPAWDPNKSPSENHAAMQAYLDEQRKKVQ